MIRAAFLPLIFWAACTGQKSGPSAPTPGADAGEQAAQSLVSIAHAEPAPRWAEAFYRGRLEEKLGGDIGRAREAYGEVVNKGGGEPHLAARAALALAELEIRTGSRRRAVELVARAEALAASEPAVRDQANRLLLELESATPQLLEISGPPPHTPIEGVSEEAKRRFERAEELLVSYHQTRVRPRLEELRASVREKQRALDSAVRVYRTTIALGEAVATVAAEYRIGSLYRDHAVSLLFDLPAELEPLEKARLRRSLRARALAELRRAQQHYERCLEEAHKAPRRVDGWRAAGELGLTAVEDLLRGHE
jgi:hypothetical protein